MYQVFSDESGIFQERFQAIGVVSGEEKNLSEIRTKLKSILNKNGVSEVKFSEVRTHRPKLRTAYAFLEKSIKYAQQKKIRIDVLTWDMHDTRHFIPNRDDIANLTRMYYKLLRHISEQWNQPNWVFYPDENSFIDWTDTIDYLNVTKTPRRKPYFLGLFDEKQHLINFTKVQPLYSEKESLIQLADLFAGMARFTRKCGGECLRWLETQRQTNQPLLFDCTEQETVDDPIKATCNRFLLVGKFYDMCRGNRLGVSLNTNKYFWTRSPRRSINFWNYEPQHDADRAPIRSNRNQ